MSLIFNIAEGASLGRPICVSSAIIAAIATIVGAPVAANIAPGTIICNTIGVLPSMLVDNVGTENRRERA